MKITREDFCDVCAKYKDPGELMLRGRTADEIYLETQVFCVCKKCLLNAIEKIDKKELEKK